MLTVLCLMARKGAACKRGLALPVENYQIKIKT